MRCGKRSRCRVVIATRVTVALPQKGGQAGAEDEDEDSRCPLTSDHNFMVGDMNKL